MFRDLVGFQIAFIISVVKFLPGLGDSGMKVVRYWGLLLLFCRRRCKLPLERAGDKLLGGSCKIRF